MTLRLSRLSFQGSALASAFPQPYHATPPTTAGASQQQLPQPPSLLPTLQARADLPLARRPPNRPWPWPIASRPPRPAHGPRPTSPRVARSARAIWPHSRDRLRLDWATKGHAKRSSGESSLVGVRAQCEMLTRCSHRLIVVPKHVLSLMSVFWGRWWRL